MALSSKDIVMNTELLSGILSAHFKKLKNRKELESIILELLERYSISLNSFLSENDIASDDYSSQQVKKIIKGLSATIKNDLFQAESAEEVFKNVIANIRRLGQVELNYYASQPLDNSILLQLKAKGCVSSRHLLTHSDIHVLLNTYLKNQAVTYTDPISLTDDQGRAVIATLMAHRDKPQKLLIPANIGGNHWVLLIRTQIDSNVHLTCWDPSSGTPDEQNKRQTVLQKLLNAVYVNSSKTHLTANYHYASEQSDSFTCGYRVVQKAFLEAGITNALTQVDPQRPTELCQTVIELVAQTDEELGKPEKRQEKSDEALAFALQKTYLRGVELTAEQAFLDAQTLLDTLNPEELDKLKNELISWTKEYEFAKANGELTNWTQQYFKKQQSPAQFKAGRKEAEISQDHFESEGIPLVVTR